MQALFFVALCWLIAPALFRVHVQHDRSRALRHELQLLLELSEVVPVDGAEVTETEGLEELPRGRSVRGHKASGRGDAGHRRCIRAAVVVEDDHDIRARDPDVVERLVGDAACERAVADDGDDAVLVAAQLTRLSEPVGVRERRRGVAVLDEVMFGLGPVRVTGETSALAKAREGGLAARHELVHVGLVAGVPDDGVVRGPEDAVQGDRELDHPEVRSQMTPGCRDASHEKLADLDHERGKLPGVHLSKARR